MLLLPPSPVASIGAPSSAPYLTLAFPAVATTTAAAAAAKALGESTKEEKVEKVEKEEKVEKKEKKEEETAEKKKVVDEDDTPKKKVAHSPNLRYTQQTRVPIPLLRKGGAQPHPETMTPPPPTSEKPTQ